MVVADLHVHTTNSDGELSLAEVPTAADLADLEAVAITDHDRPHPDLDEPVTEIDGVTVVHGIELRVEVSGDSVDARTPDGEDSSTNGGARNTDHGFRVDLLGYGLDPTEELLAECERIQRDRAERGGRIVERLESRLGVHLDVDPRPGLGRPHIARAVAQHPDLDYTVQSVFNELIGDGCPCYVARETPSFEQGRQLLGAACEIVGLAHPLRYGDPEAALALTADLDAVERWYPYERPVDPDGNLDVGPVERAIEQYDLLATGGSDAHGDTLGIAGLDREAWQEVRTTLDR